jgi:acetyl esterase/lipase
LIKIFCNYFLKEELIKSDSPITYTDWNQVPNDEKNTKKCRFLMIHAHGGGFIAHSSKSHQIYLKSWCKELQVPIVSIDYSLAPEHPFPRASQECFYVYAWCLINRHLLGWTGECVICTGDSAGGVLVTNIVQQAINFNIRVPDVLVPIYSPFLLTFSLSPSRLLAMMDPLLNMGILWRCLAAYCGIDPKTETEKYVKNEALIDENPRVAKYVDVIGEAIYMVETMRQHNLPATEYMSPLLSPDSHLEKFPKTIMIVSAFKVQY